MRLGEMQITSCDIMSKMTVGMNVTGIRMVGHWEPDSPLALSVSFPLIFRSQFVQGPHHSFRKQLSILLPEPAEKCKDSFLFFITPLPNNQAYLAHNALPLVTMFQWHVYPYIKCRTMFISNTGFLVSQISI